ncbi:malate dehydrogenase nad, putative [Ichthyophthirius multifiliis]|uniref:Malate dehydrogenase n=1 Tax=Ichthyophthirius multifiliis TaxID=5932 RepID=G0QJ20_ICHMU|nr:malate dehydrogenase nad, putative [Ichthyophthirius multifiliis]EGR34785.1 malate dehydrogenase nad, putative [Ichthyophthirius multifiliis]|eukprot:XP_004040089.1 malate dehydrogenase nad, putative [Ichthyophthirius multifiliis]
MHQNEKKLIVCVTGAAGQIGYAFLPLLLTGQCFGPNTKISLRLLDIPQCEQILKGVELELQDGAYPLLVDVNSGSNPEVLFKDADVVVFIGGVPRKPGMERKDLLKINGTNFITQGKALDQVAKKTCKSIVVANPANTNCLLLAETAKSIPKQNFSALTRLDHNRALAQIAEKCKVNINNVKNIIIWGNHSTTQYPDVNHGQVNGQNIRSIVNDDQYLNTEFIQRVQKRGGELLALRQNSSVMSAANAVKDHLYDWYFGTKQGQFVSMAVYSNGQYYGVPAGLIYSFPVTCENFEFKIVDGLNIDDFSRQKMNLTTQELQEEKNDAFQ